MPRMSWLGLIPMALLTMIMLSFPFCHFLVYLASCPSPINQWFTLLFLLLLLTIGIRRWNCWLSWTVDDACRAVETDPLLLANKETFAEMMSLFAKRERVHVHLLNKAIILLESETEPTKAALLRSIIKNTFPYYAMKERTYSPSVMEAAVRLKESRLWRHRDVAVAWFGAGLPFLSCSLDAVDHSMTQENFLLFAEHCRDQSHKGRVFLLFCGSNLRSKKEFALEVLKRDPSLYPCFTELRLRHLGQRRKRTLVAVREIKKLYNLDDLVLQKVFQFSGMDTDNIPQRVHEEAFELCAQRTKAELAS